MHIYLSFSKLHKLWKTKGWQKERMTDKKTSTKFTRDTFYAFFLCLVSQENFQKAGARAIFSPGNLGFLLSRCRANVATSNMHALPLASVWWPGQLEDQLAMLDESWTLTLSTMKYVGMLCMCCLSNSLPSQPTGSLSVSIQKLSGSTFMPKRFPLSLPLLENNNIYLVRKVF